MEPDDFIAEVYRRMAARMPTGPRIISADEFSNMSVSKSRLGFYSRLLPADKSAAIVDIGSGDGWFLKICHVLGYRNITAVDFRAEEKFAPVSAAVPAIATENMRTTIAEHFGSTPKTYDFCHMSHVIEHIPKYNLLNTIDGIFKALNRGGMILVRTPNMDSPAAPSAYYVTLAHEYGFVGSNLHSLLDICGFSDIAFHRERPSTVRDMLGRMARWPYLASSRARNRLFGANFGGIYDAELIASGRKL